jgi:hypothetical protein
LEWIPETEKGRTRNEFTPLSMYLRDCRAATLIRSRPCPIGGRFANSVRRSPEFIARTVLLPERFRVDCAVGGDTVALSHSRCDYNATRAWVARQSSLGCVGTAQREAIAGRCLKVHLWPRKPGSGGSRDMRGCRAGPGRCLSGEVPAPGAATLRGLRGLPAAGRHQSLVLRVQGGRHRSRGPGVRCRFFLHLGYLDRFVIY